MDPNQIFEIDTGAGFVTAKYSDLPSLLITYPWIRGTVKCRNLDSGEVFNYTPSKSGDYKKLATITDGTQCHVIHSDQKKGPYIPQQIISMWDSGNLTADALVLPAGQTDPILITNFLASYKSNISSKANSTGVRGLGIAMIALGVVITLHFAVIYDTSVSTDGFYGSSRVVNLGKQQNRLIGVLVGISLSVAGVIVARQKKA
jgi:hypothetical protein